MHEKFVEYGRNAREWMKKCVLLLPEIEKNRIWEKKRFGSIYEYAAKLAGMSRNKVNEALRVLNKIKDMPELRKVVEEKGITSVKPVITIATKETEKFWADKAREMPKNILETYKRELKMQTEENGLPRKPKNETLFETAKVTIFMNLDPEIAKQLEKLKGEDDWNSLMKEFLEMREQKLEEEKPKKVETDSRYIPAEIRKYVIKKTNNKCAFPGCRKNYEILHHKTRFSLEKSHDPDQIVPLCREHERLMHLGLVENEEIPPEFWRIRKKPDINHPKYKIDRLVVAHRTLAGISHKSGFDLLW